MKKIRFLTSLVLIACLVLEMPVPVFAANQTAAETGADSASGSATAQSGFDFDASDYSVTEDDRLKIKVKRNDGGKGAAVITFRVADVLSEYGTDYLILGEDGKELTRIEGNKPSPSDISPANDEEVFGSFSASENMSSPVNNGGSSLMGAVNTYLGQTGAEEENHGEEGVEALDELKKWFNKAQGAEGTLSFAKGEKEKTITVKPVNNEKSDGTRLFMVALTKADSDDKNAVIAPNATTYVNLIDDEPTVTAYTFDKTAVTLTPEEPEAQITIRRTKGANDFSTVYVSTVSGTAAEGSYEDLRLQEVAFIPGEDEKTVTLRGLDFSEGGSFGLRLEAENAEFDTKYAEITIKKNAALKEEKTYEAQSLGAGAETVIGNKSSSLDLGGIRWTLKCDGSGALYSTPSCFSLEAGDLPSNFGYMESYGTSVITRNDKLSFAGVRSFSADGGLEDASSEGDGYWKVLITPLKYGDPNYKTKGSYASTTSPSNKTTTRYSFSSQRTFDKRLGWVLTTGVTNNSRTASARSIFRTRSTVDTASFNGEAYFNVENSGSHPLELYGIQMEYTKYNLKLMESMETFTRSLYDFSSTADSGTYYSQTTFFKGETNKNYRPSAVSVTCNGNEVTSFYSNANKNIVIAPSEPEEIESNGLVLKGVYFAKASVSGSAVPTGASAGNAAENMLYLPAKDGEVVLSVNESLVNNLINAGVVNSKNPDQEDIQIFPVYAQEMMTAVMTEASDGESDFFNLEDWWISCGKKTAPDEDKLYKIENYNNTGKAAYAMNVKKASIIRLYCHVATGATEMGVCYAPASSPTDVKIAYHKKGDKIASAVSSAGISIYDDNFSQADIDMQEDYILCPALGNQSISLRYFDQYEDGVLIPDEFRPEDLSRMVGYLDDSVIYDETTGKVTDAATGKDITDTYTGISRADGIVTVDVLTGGTYSFFVVPPEGYSVQWTNMTGDINHDGVIDGEAEENAHNRHSNSVNPDYLIGNRLNVVVDQDNIQYYYQFIPLGSEVTGTKSGTIQKENATFYQLVNEISGGLPEPCISAAVYLADWNGQTNAKGKYSIQVGNLPKSGSMSASAIVDGVTYNFDVPCQYNNAKITLPALYRFSAESLSAWYGKAENEADCNSAIIVKDDTLNIKAEVGNCGTIRPAGARFELRRNGVPEYKFSSSEVTFKQGIRTGTATLTFNPLSCVEAGDRIYASFCDEDGNWYPYIDLGITFLSQLKTDKIILPMFGASTLADGEATDDTFEIIGSALCDMVMDQLGDLEISEPRVTYPTGVSEGDRSISWYETDYTFSFDKDLLPKFGKSSEDKDKKSDEENKNDMKEEAESLKSDDKKVDDNSDGKIKTKSSYIWNINLGIGFRLTISQRTDNKGEIRTYFEDMSFYVKASSESNVSVDVALPIGISILFRFDLDLKVVVVYRMYNNYKADPYHIEGTIPYEDFNIASTDSKISRQGYIFIDPTIKVTLGVKVGILSVSGKATFIIDMDFFVGEDSDSFGRLAIDLGWGIKVLGFEVYSKNTNVGNIRLFGDESFDYDVAGAAALAEGFTKDDGEFTPDKAVDRSYLKNRSSWKGAGGRLLAGQVSAAANDFGSTERILMSGTADDPYTRITELGDKKVLMVFVGDDSTRTSVNKRAVYYSLSKDNGDTWEEPKLIDDDGTADDYPDVFDLGDGKALVTWSSVDKTLPEGASVEDALRQLNLKSAVFDADTGRFGEVTQLTKTTKEDICADVLPHAAYDKDTGRIILYYTKTEYKDIDEIEDLSGAESVTAYLFCEKEGSKWVWKNTGAAYTEAEIAGAAAPETYRAQWYGQRFLDPRIDKSRSAMPLIVSSDAICYNGLGIYTWVADWDNNQNTTEDRDVFMQIYNFEKNSFTHCFRITEQSGTYTLPVLQRTGSDTLLYYGALAREETGAKSGTNEIRCVNLSDIIKKGHYTLYENGSSKYYRLAYNETFKNESGETVTQERWAPVEVIMNCGNIEDFTVCDDSKGQRYLLWTDSDEKGRQVYAAMLAEGQNEWSLPCALTCDEGYCYSDIGAAILNERIFLTAGKLNISDKSDTALVTLSHKPYSKVEIDEISVSEQYPMPGENVEVTAKLVNRGLLPVSGDYEITFGLNGGETKTKTNAAFIGGGAALVSAGLTVPEDFKNLKYTASLDGKTVEVTTERGAVLNFSGDTICDDVYTVDVTNEGNAVGSADLSAKLGEKSVGSSTLEEVDPGETKKVYVPLTLSDSDYTLVSGDLYSAEIELTVSDGENEIYTGTAAAYRTFDTEAIAALKSIKAGELSATVKVGERVDIAVPGDEANNLRIKWIKSSKTGVVEVGGDGIAEAVSEGRAKLTGLIVPAAAHLVIGADGISASADPAELIPEEMQKTVTAVVYAGENISSLSFVDVPVESYYYDAVDWASEKDIVKGIDEKHFGPGMDVTRAQTVTFLWRLAGCPQSEAEYSFTDVKDDAYYAAAVAWAVEKGITTGVSATEFDPKGLCTRAQAVTFLWRFDGCGSSDGAVNPFTDVAADAYYAGSVLWAVKNGITKGTSATEFSPKQVCSRAQMVTFLWRMSEK